MTPIETFNIKKTTSFTSKTPTAEVCINPITATTQFQLQCQFYVDPQSTILVSRYKSTQTGLTVVHVDLDSPLVSGFLTVATEAFDDCGHAHCAEHLVFLGSEQYPYKGILDSFATRAFARGTNAWTDIDHTCYNIMTAGSEGFLRFLPVYVDHILYPTLTESGFNTEIHHINGSGEDAGVVYCEVQGRQNTMFDRMQSRMRQLLYPDETCAYRNEPGGKMDSLRQLDIHQIQSYHQTYYRPDNLCIVIAGKLDPSQLFNTLNVIDQSILQHGQSPSSHHHQRPWSSCLSSIRDLSQNVTETVLFPDPDESMGAISISWLGPYGDNFFEIMAIQMLNTYLTDSSLSPLQKLLMEMDDPLCTAVECSQTEHARTSITINIENVPTDRADQVIPMVLDLLNNMIITGNMDMDRMITLIERERLKVIEGFESRALYCVPFSVINDFIYGHPDGLDLEESLQRIKPLDRLYYFTKNDWLHLLKKYYVNGCYVALIGKPSASLAQQLQDEETARVEQQRLELGYDRLQRLATQLEIANEQNEIDIPPHVLDSFPIPNASDISSINVITARHPSPSAHLPQFRNELQKYIEADQASIPYAIQYDHIQSAFTTISVYLNTGDMPSSLRPYGRLFMESFFSLSMGVTNQSKPPTSSDDLIRQLNRDTIDYRIMQGRGPIFREYIVVSLKVETDKYQHAVQWLNDLLWHTEYTADKLKMAANKILNDIPQTRRDGRKLAELVMQAYQHDIKKSTDAACGYLYQAKFLVDILEKLEDTSSCDLLDGCHQVLQDIQTYRKTICKRENIQVHVMGNIFGTNQPKSAFNIWKNQPTHAPFAPITRAKDVLSHHGRNMGHIAVMIKQPSMESTCSLHTAPGPSDFGSPDIPPLMVLIEMLNTIEGVFWRLIRGKGLAYRCWIMENIEAGSLSLWILQSPDAFKAYEQIKNVMALYADGHANFDEHSLEGAKSSIIFDLAQSEATVSIAGAHSFINQVLRQNQPEKKVFLQAIQSVTLDDIDRVLHKYLLALFRIDQSNHVVVSSPTKVDDILTGFRSIGFPMTQIIPDDIYSLPFASSSLSSSSSTSSSSSILESSSPSSSLSESSLTPTSSLSSSPSSSASIFPSPLL
ncbi:Metalloenzyme, LuxS/M16 peptidase-like protein [Halteromyces radiatus]|uniref:Metalloenzyme, LuxS/M16 peptidase-like protein n=1 Tax=Halteromyces radiatus TaxID=101107 RepID=UPI00221EAAB3|nr:Metalloenzyme, LuxS/M16 peptidase-like protein [Halteromyces radiatus]KAI8096963.1 Metalloenzyme, LuxS/M16 peptidase-like protein [Halteromyces radiatus]